MNDEQKQKNIQYQYYLNTLGDLGTVIKTTAEKYATAANMDVETYEEKLFDNLALGDANKNYLYLSGSEAKTQFYNRNLVGINQFNVNYTISYLVKEFMQLSDAQARDLSAYVMDPSNKGYAVQLDVLYKPYREQDLLALADAISDPNIFHALVKDYLNQKNYEKQR